MKTGFIGAGGIALAVRCHAIAVAQNDVIDHEKS